MDTINSLNEHFVAMFETTIVDCPAIGSTSVTSGAYVTDKTVSISKTGYTPVAVSLYRNNNDNWFSVNVGFNNNTTGVAFHLYHARSSSDDSLSAGAIKAKVLWIKSEFVS